jgi:nucleolar GTP-binding protein
MSFIDIRPIMSANEYIDIAIRKANKEAAKLAGLRGNTFNIIKTIEMKKLYVIKEDLISKLDKIVKEFPHIEDLNLFYSELVEVTIGSHPLKQALLEVDHAKRQINKFYNQYNRKVQYSRGSTELHNAKRSYYGRVTSVVKKLPFEFFKQARIQLLNFPVIKSDFVNIAISGFPNVGKTTLLSKLTGSTPEIAAYPFTTKGIMIGYYGKCQLLDTPGTLNRFNKMNYIEQQAFLAMKIIADKIIYVFDLTEPYPLKDQEKLLTAIREFKKPVIVYLSKTDILDKDIVDEFKKKHKSAINDIEELKKVIS